MRCETAVFGRHGARMARALVFSAMAGLLPGASLDLILIGVPVEDRYALTELIGAYTELSGPLSEQEEGPFSATFSAAVWPQTEEGNLNSLSAGEGDKLLRDALFTREEASGALLTGAAPVASLGFHRLLAGGLLGALREARERMSEGAPLLLMGSLAEACCAAGCRTVGEALREVCPEARIGAVLETCVYRSDDAALCKAALRQLDLPLDALWLAGYPEDCQIADELPQICDWLCAQGAEAFLCGKLGGYAFHAPGGPLDWPVFGTEGTRVREAHEALLRSVWLMKTDLLPTVSRLQNTNRLMTRYPRWYSLRLGGRKSTESERETTARLADKWRFLADAYLSWLRDIQTAVPYPMRLSEAVREGTAAAEEHYRAMLRNAGLLALMQHDAEESELREELVIHRYSMKDDDGEATLKQIDELESQLLQEKSDQLDLNRAIGGRASLRMLERVAAETRKSAGELRAQVEEGRRRIERAEQLATVEEMPRVDTAKARLGRLERRLATLDGCARQTEGDLAAASLPEQRLQAPSLPGADTAEALLFSRDLISALLSIDTGDPKAQKQKAQELMSRWPWPEHGPRQLLAQLDVQDGRFPDAPGFARLVNSLLAAAK